MVIDSRIPLGVQPLRLESPLATAGQAMQLQAMQQQRALYGAKLAEMQRAQQQQAAVQEIAQQAGGDLPKLIKGLYDRGMVDMAMGLEAKLAEREKGQVDLQKSRVELGKEHANLLSGAFRFLGANPSDERITATIGGMVQRGALPAEMGQQFAGDLMQLPPEARTQALVTLARTPEQFAALYTPKMEKIDDGQAITFRDVNPNTNPNATAPVARQMTPGEVQSARDAAASRAIAAGNLQVARDRLALDASMPPITNVVDTPQGLVGVDRRGGLHQLGPGGPAGNVSVGEPSVVPGGAGMPPQGGQPAPQQPQGAAPGFETKAQAEARLGREKAALGRDNALVAARTVLTSIDRALGSVNGWNAGALGWARSFLPGSSARDLNATLDTIKGNLSFDRLQQMREASATGGALGSITERELDLLGSTLASLEIGQSPEKLAQGLQDVRQRYGRIVANLEAIGRGETQAPAGDPRETLPAQPNTPQQVSGQIDGPPQGVQRMQVDRLPMPRDVPVGAIATDESGRRFRNDGRNWVPMR